jgi:hypothetical protein
MCKMTKPRNETWNSVLQLLFIAAVLVVGYTCMRTLSFTVWALNFSLQCAVYAIPLLAVVPVLRLKLRARIWGLILLGPLFLLTSFLLLGTVVFDGLLGGRERKEPLQTFQEGSSTIQLQRYENGGAVGVHGFNLEQRRLIVPGLYIVRSVDFFEWAREGTLSAEGPYRVRVHAKGGYSKDYEVDKVYSLKPWVYF